MRTGNWRNLLLGAGLIALGVVSQSALVLAGGMTKEEKWADRATDPPGTRQVYKYGKLWPPQPRPTGREQSWKHKFHHAHYWPYPYNDTDRQIVRDTLAQQTAGGWVLATTLHDYHFNAETNELNSAGRSHLYWIMTSVPAQFRTVFVAHGLSPQVDEVRVATVDRSAREFGEQVPPVVMRHSFPSGRPADEADTIRRLELQSWPAQRIFTISPDTSGTGSSSGSTGTSMSR